MNVSRNFLLISVVYLIAGMLLGTYMMLARDPLLKPVHAHVNLLGFTLMGIFAAIYKVFPAMAVSKLASKHFWLHQIGLAIMMGGMAFMFIRFDSMGTNTMRYITMTVIVSIVLLVSSVLVFGWNVYKNAK